MLHRVAIIIPLLLLLVVLPVNAALGPDYYTTLKNGTVDLSGSSQTISSYHYYQSPPPFAGSGAGWNYQHISWNWSVMGTPSYFEIPNLAAYNFTDYSTMPASCGAVEDYYVGATKVFTVSFAATKGLEYQTQMLVDLVGTITYVNSAYIAANPVGSTDTYSTEISNTCSAFFNFKTNFGSGDDGASNKTKIIDLHGLGWFRSNIGAAGQTLVTSDRHYITNGVHNWNNSYEVTNSMATRDKTVNVTRWNLYGSTLRYYTSDGLLAYSSSDTSVDTSYSFVSAMGRFAVVPSGTSTEYTIFDDSYDTSGGVAQNSMYGYTMDGYTVATLSTVAVQVNHGATLSTNTSTPAGYYLITGLENGVSTTVDASHAGYTFVPFAFTPAGNLSYHVNLTLIPTTIPGFHNAAIDGIVYTSWSHDPINGATVTIVNGTFTDTYTTGAGGFYLFNNLAPATVYTITATAPAHAPSGAYPVTTVGGSTVQQDVSLNGAYIVTIYVKDAATGALVIGTTVSIQASDGQTANTTFGTTTFTMNGGYFTFTATATGYSAGQMQESITGDTTITILLSKSSEQSSINYYMQKTVRLRVVDAYGIPLVGTTIMVNYIASTLPSTNITWLVSAFGISSSVASEMTNGGIAMTGITTDDGSVTFVMFPALSYGVTLTNTLLGLSHYTTISPQDSDYTIYAVLPSQARQNSTYMALSNTTLFITEPTASTVTFNLIYFDPTGLTTNLKFNVTCWSNNTPMYYVDLGNPGTSVVADSSYTVPNVKGQEWRFWYNATRSAPL